MIKSVKLLLSVAGVAVTLSAAPASAVTVDPVVGDAGWFIWKNGKKGNSRFLSGEYPSVKGNKKLKRLTDPTVDLTLATESLVTFSVLDCCKRKDSFKLLLDGNKTAWDTADFTGPDASGKRKDHSFFEATVALLLGPGTYSFDLAIRKANKKYPKGAGAWSLAVESIEEPSAVPLPASLPLLLTGVAAFAGLRRRRKA